MKPNPIQYCEQNVTRDERIALEQAVPNAEGRMCLANCTMCFDTKFAEINGELVTEESFDALIMHLREACRAATEKAASDTTRD